MTAYGVDGCRAGWFYVAKSAKGLSFGVVGQLIELL